MRRPDVAVKGDNAAIGIGVNSSDTGCQIRFWYWLSDYQFASLRINTRTGPGDSWKLIDVEQQVKASWFKAEIDLPVMKTRFEVIIEGVLGVGLNGFLALDGVSFTPQCKVDETKDLPPPSSTTTLKPGNFTTIPGKTTTQSDKCPAGYCKNGGTCLNTNGIFSCKCPAGFTGKFCENSDPELNKKGSSKFKKSLFLNLTLSLIFLTKRHWAYTWYFNSNRGHRINCRVHHLPIKEQQRN